MAGGRITDIVWKMAEPLAAQNNAEIWDVEYIKEGADWYLRVFLDGSEGISINQCEAVNRALGDLLDEADPIPHSYYLEVSSAGIERALKRECDFLRYIGHKILVRLYKAEDGSKEFSGVLRAFENGLITIEPESGGQKSFERAAVSKARLVAEF
jgi:ribosome maturation factor RimP